MKRVATILSLGAVLAATPAADGTATVWYSNPTFGGAPGTTLQLLCPSASIPCSFNVTMNVTWNPGGAERWATDLSIFPTPAWSVTNVMPLPSPFNFAVSGGVGGGGAALLVGSQGASLAVGGVGAGTYSLLSFTLTRPAVPFFTPQDVWATNGLYEWATAGDYETVNYGPSAPIPGTAGSVGSLPVMRIYNSIPEPVTAGLLAMGGTWLIVRRRRTETSKRQNVNKSKSTVSDTGWEFRAAGGEQYSGVGAGISDQRSEVSGQGWT